MFLDRAKEWGRHRVLGTKIISEECQYRNKSVATVHQGEVAECVERTRPVGNRRKQSADVAFFDTLWEERNDSENLSCVSAKLLEH